MCPQRLPVRVPPLDADHGVDDRSEPKLKGIATGSYPLEPATMRKDVSGVAAAEAAGVPFLLHERQGRDGGRQSAIGGATSNLMVSLLLNLAYRVVDADRYCRRLGYFQEMTMDLMGVGTFGKTVSLIGLGGIASAAPSRRSTASGSRSSTRSGRVSRRLKKPSSG